MGTRYRSQSNGAKRVGRGEARAARVFSRQELEVTAEYPCYRISMRELRVPGVLCAACLTNVAADKPLFGCGFAAMVVACLQLN
jgi:hypothetical protein